MIKRAFIVINRALYQQSCANVIDKATCNNATASLAQRWACPKTLLLTMYVLW